LKRLNGFLGGRGNSRGVAPQSTALGGSKDYISPLEGSAPHRLLAPSLER
jgi:hypothetical protein